MNHSKRSPPSPGLIAILLLIVGSLLFISLIYNFPIPNGADINEDGMSDNFQKIHPKEDVVKRDGQWVVETVGYTAEADVPYLLFAGSMLFIVIPLGPAIWLWDRPRRKLGVARWKEEGRMHDAVRRIAAFLEINPSLPSAVRLTRASMPNDEQSLLGELLWAPFSEGSTFNSVYSSFADRWKTRSPLLGNALSGLSSAERENGPAAVMVSARAVVERLSEGSKAMMESYSRSLAGPSTALFGIGVLLPILLAAMIPITGITGRTAILLGFILWFVLPAGIMMIGIRLVTKRPSLGSRGEVRHRMDLTPRFGDIIWMLSGASLTASSIYIAVKGAPVDLPLETSSMIVLTSFTGISLMVAGLIMTTTRDLEKKETEWNRIRSGAPSILRDVSSSIQEGHSFEHAVKTTFAGTENNIFPGVELDRSGIDEPLLSYLESSREFSKAGKGPGGKAIRAYSKHIKDMTDLERDLSSRVRSAIGQMEITASIFAPLMIGTSAGIFTLMGSMGSGTTSGMLLSTRSMGIMEPWQFLLLTGGYLFTLSIVTTLTIYRLEFGRTKGGWHKVPRRLIQSSFAFCLGALGSSLIMG